MEKKPKLILTFHRGCETVIMRTYENGEMLAIAKDVIALCEAGYKLKGHMENPPREHSRTLKPYGDPVDNMMKTYRGEIREDTYQAKRAKNNLGTKTKRGR